MTDTPETKAFKTRIRGIDGDKHWVPALFAERLERERDEAREQLRIAVGLLSTAPQFAIKHPEEVLAFVKEVTK
jgi:hypothetical protein